MRQRSADAPPADARTIDNLLTRSDVAGILGITTRTLDRWISDGRLAVVRLGDHTVRIARAELERFIRESSEAGRPHRVVASAGDARSVSWRTAARGQ